MKTTLRSMATIVALCALSYTGNAQPVTGQRTYDHSGNQSILSSANYANWGPGFLMGGYKPNNSGGGPLIFIDRTNYAGNFGGSGTFSNGYYVTSGGPNCSQTQSAENRCYGLSVFPKGYETVIAGAFDSGCIIGLVDSAGDVVNNMLFRFPAGSSDISAPLVTKAKVSSTQQALFYACGSYVYNNTRTMYVVKVDVYGTPFFSVYFNNIYDIGANDSLLPRAIVENPFTNDLAIVGQAYSANSGTNWDAFFMTINVTNGSPNLYETINRSSAITDDEFFSSISLASANDGYIIGGSSGSSVEPWMIRLDSTGAVDWSTNIQPNVTYGATEVKGVIERFKSGNASEYYGATTSQSSMMVFKLDNSGNPFSTGPSIYDQFVYSVAGSDISTAAISLRDVGSTNDGIHVYGTVASGGGPGDFFLSLGCFNGAQDVTCTNVNPAMQVMGTIPASTTGPNNVNTSNVNIAQGVLPCQYAAISTIPLTYNPNTLCFGSGLPTTPYVGSNARPIATSIAENQQAENSNLTVYPNPVANKASLTYNLTDNSPVKIELYNNIGQLIKTMDEGEKASGTYTLDLDMQELNLANGIYLAKAHLNGHTTTCKIVYSKN